MSSVLRPARNPFIRLEKLDTVAGAKNGVKDTTLDRSGEEQKLDGTVSCLKRKERNFGLAIVFVQIFKSLFRRDCDNYSR